MQLKKMIADQGRHITLLEASISKCPTNVTMGKSLERISLGIPKELGKRPHAFKLDDPTFLIEETLDEEGKILKGGVEQVIEKMEIVSKHCLNQKKFKLNAQQRINKLE